MLAKGSGGEKYTLDTKKKHVYRTYTDYPVAGGCYVARIMDRGHRRGDVEAGRYRTRSTAEAITMTKGL